MRNLLQYPLDSNEAIKILERIQKEILDQELIGDMRAYAVGKIIEFIKTNNQGFQIFLDKNN